MQHQIILDRILGCIYGQAIGDAMGMPSELWPKKKVENYFGWISHFLDGPQENSAANGFKKGEFTDDTQQAIALMDALIESRGNIDPYCIARHLLLWAAKIDAFNKNILGPTSKKALLDIKQGIDIQKIEANGLTNGAAMRVSPLGCALSFKDDKQFYHSIKLACSPTHKSDIAVAGAFCIALAISLAIEGEDWHHIKLKLIELVNKAQLDNITTFTPLLGNRISMILEATEKIKYSSKQDALDHLYYFWGAGMDTLESVAMAIALVELADTSPTECAILAANLGGDTDTIGAMATAICGAMHGVGAFPQNWIATITLANKVDIPFYANQLFDIRNQGGCYERE